MMKLLIAFIYMLSAFSYAELQTSSGGGRGWQNRYNQGPYVGECYSYVRTLVQEGKEDTSLGIVKSMHGICSKNVGISEVQKNFGESENFASFLGQTKYSHFSKELQFDLSKCSKEKATPVHEIASRYYYLLNRIDQGQQSLVRQMSSLSLAMGDTSFIKQLGCSKSEFTEVQEICQKANSCPAPEKSLNKLAEQTDKTLAQINDIEQEIKKLEVNIKHPRTPQDKKAEYQNQLNWSRLQIETLKSLIPWAAGDVFKKTISSKRPTIEAIQNQLKEDRKNLLKSFQETEKHKRCIIGKPQRTDACDPGAVVELADYTSPLPSITNIPKDKDMATRKKYALASLEADSQQCIFEGRVDQMKTSSVINESLTQAGITVLTLGLGSAVSVGKLLTSRALMTERAADGIVKGATLTKNTINGGVFLKDAKDASEVCQKFAASSASTKPQSECAIESLVDNFSASKDYTDCIVASAFVLASGGTFAVGKIRGAIAKQNVARLEAETQKKLEKFLEAYQSGNKSAILSAASKLDDAARFKAAEAILGRELSLAEKRAVLKAHEIAPEKEFFEYTPAELKEKLMVLSAAGIGVKDADKIMRTGITGKFSSENAKIAEEGLLDAQMKERTTLENLKSYEDDFKSQTFARSELDKKLNKVKSEIDDTEKKLKNPNITATDKAALETKLEQLNQSRSETFKKLTEGTESITEHISDTRSSVIKRTEEIDRIRTEFYERTGKGLNANNPRLVDRLTTRKSLFETEGFLEIQKNGGDPTSSIAAFRRATKDLNEIQSMGIASKGPQEVLSQVRLRAVSQDLKGITGSEMQSLVNGKIGKLEKGVELITGDITPPKQLPIIKGSKVDTSVWEAYQNLAKRKADQYVISDLLENPGFLKSNNIKSDSVDKINEIYVANRERAAKELKAAIERFYSKNPSAAKDALKTLLEW